MADGRVSGDALVRGCAPEPVPFTARLYNPLTKHIVVGELWTEDRA
ncbi:MAG: hypothetical protein H0U65_01690 [Rubrobacter sp.]|jgi:hypothetical protein|nr:hypothetical protein [Rubrobacter sp.]